MTNTLKVPEKNLEYYKLKKMALTAIAIVAAAFVGYVYAILDIAMNIDRLYPDAPRDTTEAILGLGRQSGFGTCLVVLVVVAMLAIILFFYFRHEADKRLTNGVADLGIAWCEREIDELRQKNLKAKGDHIEKAKRVDEIEALMIAREGHQ